MRSLKHKQRRKIALLLVVVSIAIIGIIGGNRMNEPTEKEKQIAFLKKNEDTIINKAFVINGEMTVKNIHFKWDTVQIEYSGLITSSPYALSIKVSSTLLSNGKTYEDTLVIKTDTEKLDKITSVVFR